MKKEELKKTYENMEISSMQRQRIYDDIIENSKSLRRKSPLPIVASLLGCAAVSAFVLTVALNGGIPGGENINGYSTLSANYKREIMAKASTYLEANNYDLSKINSGDSIEIDASKIVDSEEYNTCEGNLVIKRYNDDYTYTVEASCKGEPTESKVEYNIYEGLIRDVRFLGDKTLINSATDFKEFWYKKENLSAPSHTYGAKLMLFDKDGSVLWDYIIDKTEDNQSVDVFDVKEVSNGYFVMINRTNYYVDGKFERSYDCLFIDYNGKAESVKLFGEEYTGEYDEHWALYMDGITLDKLPSSDKDAYLYYLEGDSIIAINPETRKYYNIWFDREKLFNNTSYFLDQILGVYDGVVYIYTVDEKTDVYTISAFDIRKDYELVGEVEIDEKFNGNVDSYVTSDGLYLLRHVEIQADWAESASKVVLSKYDFKLNKVGEFTLNEGDYSWNYSSRESNDGFMIRGYDFKSANSGLDIELYYNLDKDLKLNERRYVKDDIGEVAALGFESNYLYDFNHTEDRSNYLLLLSDTNELSSNSNTKILFVTIKK